MKRIIVFFTVFMGLIFLAHEWIYPAWIKDIEPKKEEKKEEPPPAEQPVEEPKEEPKEEKKGTMPSSVEFISVVKEAEGKVKINWEPPLGTEIMALIYRDTQMMNTKDKIAQDKYINSVDTGAGEFIDQPDASGKYFYAIITVKGEVTNYFLIEDQNYNTIPVDIVAKQIPVKIKLAAPITRIKAELGEDSKSIKLIWKGETNAQKYNIYRASEVLDSDGKIKTATLITSPKVDPEFVAFYDEEHVDTTVTFPGEYYYAITTVNQAGENLSLIPDGNYTTVAVGIKEEQKPEPVIEEKKEEPVEEKPVIKKVVKPKPKVKKKKAVDYSVKLEKVIHDYYYKSEYEKAVKDLNWILKKSSSQRVKNKANLFLGKSYFYTGEYKKALNIFIILKPVYPDEASFWIQQVLRKLR